VARRLRVALTYADHTAATRAMPLHAAALDAELWDAARRAFTQANARRLAVRAVALTLDQLEETEAQLELWEMVAGPAPEKPVPSHPEPFATAQGDSEPLQDAIDRIRSRWGTRGVLRGTGLALSGGGSGRSEAQMPSGPSADRDGRRSSRPIPC
jgi:hypothetical protein